LFSACPQELLVLSAGSKMSRALRAQLILWGVVAVAAFGVFLKIHYSDGDDAIFDQAVRTTAYFDYIKERFCTWSGRIGGETAVYITFALGIWFWRVVNALMVAALPILAYIAISKSLSLKNDTAHPWLNLRLPLACYSCYLLMDIVTFGHAAVWVNGSVFYTWAIVAGTISLVPPLISFSAGKLPGKYPGVHFAYAIPCGIFAATSIEQIGFALIAILGGIVTALVLQKRKVPVGIIIELTLCAIAFGFAVIAPGNAIRVSSETETWFPGFTTLPAAEHAFISLQWLLSSFANEGKLFFVFIWIAGAAIAGFKTKKTRIFSLIAATFTIAAILPFFGINMLSDTGIRYIDPAVRPDVFPSIAAASTQNKIAMVWWTLATIFSAFLVWKSAGLKTLALFVLAILCESMMFFSPTIYASGERVFYTSDWILMATIIVMWTRIRSEFVKNGIIGLMLIVGVINLATQIPDLLAKLNG